MVDLLESQESLRSRCKLRDVTCATAEHRACVVCGAVAHAGTGWWAVHPDQDATPVCCGACWKQYQAAKEARRAAVLHPTGDQATRMRAAARHLVVALNLYSGHPLSSRGPYGLVLNALRELSPHHAELLADGMAAGEMLDEDGDLVDAPMSEELRRETAAAMVLAALHNAEKGGPNGDILRGVVRVLAPERAEALRCGVPPAKLFDSTTLRLVDIPEYDAAPEGAPEDDQVGPLTFGELGAILAWVYNDGLTRMRATLDRDLPTVPKVASVFEHGIAWHDSLWSKWPTFARSIVDVVRSRAKP